MTLAAHALVGAAAATAVPGRPLLAFLAGFVSHFVIDMIPHWDYQLGSYRADPRNPLNDDMVIGKSFAYDLVKIAVDIAIGLTLAFAIFRAAFPSVPLVAILAGAAGGIVPDALQFAYWKFRHEPLTSLQRFHIKIQKRNHFHNVPFTGILLQVFTAAAAILLAAWNA